MCSGAVSVSIGGDPPAIVTLDFSGRYDERRSIGVDAPETRDWGSSRRRRQTHDPGRASLEFFDGRQRSAPVMWLKR